MHNPLVRKRILVTRPEAQAEGFCADLERAGAVPIRFPTIRIESMPDEGPLREALGRLAAFHWAIYTSVNGVAHVWERHPGPWPSRLRVAAIGPATAQALQARGVKPEFVPEEFRAERVAEGLGQVTGRRILLARAEGARPVLAEMLRARGALVEEIPAYRTVRNTPPCSAFAALEAGVDAITFTSSSTARHFASLVPDLGGVPIACIGPVTAMTAQNLGYTVDVIAERYTMGGLMEALTRYFATAQRS